jgi:hypothetical protein
MTELTSFQQRLRDFLTSHAPEKITYQELARVMDPDVNPRDRRFKRLTTALYHVNTYEHENGRPMIGALVVRASDGLPGDGFYWCARQLGFEFEDSEAAAFWKAELAQVSEYWGSQPQETQLDRIEAKLDQILKRLAKPAPPVKPPAAAKPTPKPRPSANSVVLPPGTDTTESTRWIGTVTDPTGEVHDCEHATRNGHMTTESARTCARRLLRNHPDGTPGMRAHPVRRDRTGRRVDAA